MSGVRPDPLLQAVVASPSPLLWRGRLYHVRSALTMPLLTYLQYTADHRALMEALEDGPLCTTEQIVRLVQACLPDLTAEEAATVTMPEIVEILQAVVASDPSPDSATPPPPSPETP